MHWLIYKETSQFQKNQTIGIQWVNRPGLDPNFLAHQIKSSSVFTYMSKFYLAYPVPIGGKDKYRTAARWKTSDAIVMLKCRHRDMSYDLSLSRNFWETFLNMKMRYLW